MVHRVKVAAVGVRLVTSRWPSLVKPAMWISTVGCPWGAPVPGHARLTLTAARSLDASLSGTGSIVYGGDPSNVSTRVTGTGTITSR